MFDTLSRYVLKRTGLRFLLLFTVFMAVLVGGQIALLLGRGVPPEACLPMLEALSLLSVPIALPVSFATAILVVIGGMVQDGEFRALASSGVSHRRVLVRMIPLLLLAVALCGLLTHWVLPVGVADMRANKGRMLQTAIASRVAEGDAIFENKGMTVWVGAADGSRLNDVHALMLSGEEVVAVYAPTAHWVMTDHGIHLQCDDVEMLVRNRGNHLMTLDTERYSYRIENDLANRDKVEPDALSTAEVLRLAATLPKAGESHAIYNNARLTLNFRFFLPLSLIAFALLAMGLGLAFGTDQNLPGIILIVVVVAAVIYPAFGYVKNQTGNPQINPAFLMWPPGFVVGLIGAWIAWSPDRARELMRAPLDWWLMRREAKRA